MWGILRVWLLDVCRFYFSTGLLSSSVKAATTEDVLSANRSQGAVTQMCHRHFPSKNCDLHIRKLKCVTNNTTMPLLPLSVTVSYDSETACTKPAEINGI